MKKEEMIQKAYEIAVERYAAVGVDTEKVLKTMQDFHLSLHCWQADDVTGFEVQAGALSGGRFLYSGYTPFESARNLRGFSR